MRAGIDEAGHLALLAGVVELGAGEAVVGAHLRRELGPDGPEPLDDVEHALGASRRRSTLLGSSSAQRRSPSAVKMSSSR